MNTPSPSEKDISASVRLSGIRLASINADYKQHTPGELHYEIGLSVFKPQIQTKDNKRLLLCRHEISLKGAKGNETDNIPMTADIALESIYELLDDKLKESEFQEFAESSATVNVWPYFRELIQNISSRMLVPNPIMLPLFVVKKAKAK